MVDNSRDIVNDDGSIDCLKNKVDGFTKIDKPHCDICNFKYYATPWEIFLNATKRHTCRCCNRSICSKPICSSKNKNKENPCKCNNIREAKNTFSILKDTAKRLGVFDYIGRKSYQNKIKLSNDKDHVLIELCGPCRVNPSSNHDKTMCVFCKKFGPSLSRKIKKELEQNNDNNNNKTNTDNHMDGGYNKIKIDCRKKQNKSKKTCLDKKKENKKTSAKKVAPKKSPSTNVDCRKKENKSKKICLDKKKENNKASVNKASTKKEPKKKEPKKKEPKKKETKPEFIQNLNKLLKLHEKLYTNVFNSSIDLAKDLLNEFYNLMDKHPLKKKDIDIIQKGNGMYVIEPPDYIKVTKLNKDSEAITQNKFSLDAISNPEFVLTTGDNPGFGDVWYKAKSALIKPLTKLIEKYVKKLEEFKKTTKKDKKKSNISKKIEFRIKYDAAKDDVVGVPIELLNRNLSKVALQLVNKEEIVISENKIKIAGKFKDHSNLTSLCKKNGFTRFDLLKYILKIYKKEYGSNLHDKIITGLKLKGDVYWINVDS